MLIRHKNSGSYRLSSRIFVCATQKIEGELQNSQLVHRKLVYWKIVQGCVGISPIRFLQALCTRLLFLLDWIMLFGLSIDVFQVSGK